MDERIQNLIEALPSYGSVADDEVIGCFSRLVTYIANGCTSSGNYYVSFKSLERLTGYPVSFFRDKGGDIAVGTWDDDMLCDCHVLGYAFDCTTWWCPSLNSVPLRLWSPNEFEEFLRDLKESNGMGYDEGLTDMASEALKEGEIKIEDMKWKPIADYDLDMYRLCRILNLVGGNHEV